jgi:hypothetical protein
MPTIYAVMLVVERVFYSWACHKWPRPREEITRAHATADVGPDANIKRKLLMLDLDFASIRSVQIAAQHACTSQDGMVALHFPAFDCGHIQS